MSADVTAKMWGIFDETGLFLCLCQHGFVLAIADMSKRGIVSAIPNFVLILMLIFAGQSIPLP